MWFKSKKSTNAAVDADETDTGDHQEQPKEQDCGGDGTGTNDDGGKDGAISGVAKLAQADDGTPDDCNDNAKATISSGSSTEPVSPSTANVTPLFAGGTIAQAQIAVDTATAVAKLENDPDGSGVKDEAKEDDLDQMLADMDIDEEFNIWSSPNDQNGEDGDDAAVAATAVLGGDGEVDTATNKDSVAGKADTAYAPGSTEVVWTSLDSTSGTKCKDGEIVKVIIMVDDDDDKREDDHKAEDERQRRNYQREEIYSTRYRPTSQEEAELHDTETWLRNRGVVPNTSRGLWLSALRKTSQSNRAKSTAGVQSSTSASTQPTNSATAPVAIARLSISKQQQARNLAAWNDLARTTAAPAATATTTTGALGSSSRSSSTGSSIGLVLKHGPCQCSWLPNTSSSDRASGDAPLYDASDLVVLTRGWAVAAAMAMAAAAPTKDNAMEPAFVATPWSHVDWIQPNQGQHSITIAYRQPQPQPNSKNVTDPKMADDPSSHSEADVSSPLQQLVVTLPDLTQYQSWWDALSTILVRYHEYNNTRTDLGWQYHFVYTPYFTMAVTNLIDSSTGAVASNDDSGDDDNINTLDTYNGLSPLHYAVKCNHGPAVAALLEAGADANGVDAEKNTPMYWAVREQASPMIVSLLAQHGATDKAETYEQTYSRGELFGRVAATEQILHDKKEKEAATRAALEQEKAQATASVMANNLKLLQQRGEQIDELGSKATELNQGAQDFASMARQLKEASKKKSQWLPF